MHLLNLNLQPPSAINCAVYGNFSSARAQECVVSHGTVLELLRPDDNGKIHSITSIEVFGIIRSLIPFRLTGGNKDYIVVGTDSGGITILEYNNDSNMFDVKHREIFGKSGCRRITPGEYLAADPKGRAILIGAIEKQKLVYVMNRDASNRLTISSPLEGHRSSTIHFDIVGLDVGFENPIFAVLEIDYSDADSDPSGQALEETSKTIVYYELDLGLNHVTRRWSDQVERTANKLIAVPGGNEGPGGALVCSENWIEYKHEGHPTLKAILPRREHYPDDKNLLIVASSTHKQRDLFFILAQSELGDIYKITLDYEGENVSQMTIKFFDSLPPSNAMCITKTGFLFVASEFSNHYLFHFQGIGDDDDTASSDSSMMDVDVSMAPKFSVRKLKNLAMVDEMESLAPITDMKIDDLTNEQTPQIYTLCGRGHRSTLRILRHGLAMTEMAISELPGNPSAVWCVKLLNSDDFDKYIVLSFQNATLVLSIGETVEEVSDSGFLTSTPTLSVALLEDDSLLQIHANGIRHISKFRPITEWKAPGKKIIEKCAVNSRQIVISLAGGELIYFELDTTNGELVEKITVELGIEIACLDIGVVPKSRQRFPFLAVGGYDNTVRILSLDPADLMKQRSTQALNSPAESLCIVEMLSDTGDATPLYLNIGMHNGVLQRTLIDDITGNLSDSRTRFLGSLGVKLFRLNVNGSPAVLAISSRAWLAYTFQKNYHLTPLSYTMLNYASGFTSEQCPEGIVAVADNTLRILGVERLGEVFNQQKVPLKYTPRKMVVHPLTKKIIIIESDQNEYTTQERQKMGWKDLSEQSSDANDMDEAEVEEPLPVRGPVPSKKGKWASCIRLFDPIQNETKACLDLDENEAALSIGTVTFHDRGAEAFVIVGTVKSLNLHSRKNEGGFLRVYRLIEGEQLVLLHVTPVEGIPYAICQFQGRALISVDKTLRIYDLGKRKLLRKCENKNFPTFITTVSTAGERIYVSDIHESFHFLKYHRADNQLIFFADDCVPRFVTCQVLLDYDTIAGGDKFGNIFVCRLPSEVSDEVDNPTGSRMLWDTGRLNGAPNKLEQVVQYHVGSVITSLTKTRLVPGGVEALIFSTVTGSIGALIPFQSREDVAFFTHLEMYMRQECPPLCGRDHLAYRSYFVPVKDVTDGVLCDQFLRLPLAKQKTISDDLDRSPSEVTKKLEDIRNRLL